MCKFKVSMLLLLSSNFTVFSEVKELSEIQTEQVVKSDSGDIITETKTLKAGGDEIQNTSDRPIKLKFGKDGKNGHGTMLSNAKLKLLSLRSQKTENINFDIDGEILFKLKNINYPPEEFRVRSPVSVTGVRGTTFGMTNNLVKLPEGKVSITPIVDGKEDTAKVQELLAGNQSTVTNNEVVIKKLENPKKEWALIAPHEVFPPLIPVCIEVKPAQVPHPMGVKTEWKGHKVVGDKIIVNKCYMSKNEATNKEYNVFLEWHKLTGSHEFCHPDEPADFDHSPKYTNVAIAKGADKLENPVDALSYFDAYACANFYGGRLPTGFEYFHLIYWEKTKKWNNDYLDVYPHKNNPKPHETTTKILKLIGGNLEYYNEGGYLSTADGRSTLNKSLNYFMEKPTLSVKKESGFRIVYDQTPPKQLNPVYTEPK